MPERDWSLVVAALRAKAARADTDGSVTADEAKSLLEKAAKLEAKYGQAAIPKFNIPRYDAPTTPTEAAWNQTFDHIGQYDAWLDSIIDTGYLYDNE